jgi:alpha-tubulin suppressor-like RCC1 family protein
LALVVVATGMSGLAAPAWASDSLHTTSAALTQVVSIAGNSLGGSYCGLLSTGRVDCWGYNPAGQLGNGTTVNSDVPVVAKGITNATSIAADSGGGSGSNSSFCAVLSTHQVKCWGYGLDGELGNGATTNFTVPVTVKKLTTVVAVTGTDYGFCAVLSTGHVACWGYGAYGELGNGSFSTNSDVPVAVRKITTAKALTGGYYGFCARLSTGHADCWGYGVDGELGDHATANSDVPVGVFGISTAKTIASDSLSGSYCAVLSTGRVNCWGYNATGELGNGTTASSDVPVAAKGVTNATSITENADGSNASFCAVLSTHHLMCWGYGLDGELGNGTTETFTVPVSVKNLSTAVAVTGTDYGFCALLSTSHVACWGYGPYGELGNGSFSTNSDVPVAVRKITNAKALTGGYYGYCARLSTGQGDCWGYGADGELGDGTTSNSDVPVSIHSAS